MDELELIRATKMRELLRKAEAPSGPLMISDANFDETIKKNRLVVVDCWAEWCGPCRMISPVIDQLAKEYAKKVLFAKLDVDNNPVTAAKFDIMSIPTLLIIKDATLAERIVGAVPKNHIEVILRKYL
ncbi:thioredoxin [Candidatus Bathyarchaeota archaeon]|nr:thioredoxin [Candidatus Bathyarchaeota archaeon]